MNRPGVLGATRTGTLDQWFIVTRDKSGRGSARTKGLPGNEVLLKEATYLWCAGTCAKQGGCCAYVRPLALSSDGLARGEECRPRTGLIVVGPARQRTPVGLNQGCRDRGFARRRCRRAAWTDRASRAGWAARLSAAGRCLGAGWGGWCWGWCGRGAGTDKNARQNRGKAVGQNLNHGGDRLNSKA